MRIAPVNNYNNYTQNKNQSFGMAVKTTPEAQQALQKMLNETIFSFNKKAFSNKLAQIIEEQKDNPVDIIVEKRKRALFDVASLVAKVEELTYTQDEPKSLAFLEHAANAANMKKLFKGTTIVKSE